MLLYRYVSASIRPTPIPTNNPENNRMQEGIYDLNSLIQWQSLLLFLTLIPLQKFNIPIQIQPQIFCTLALVSWAQILIYNKYIPPFHSLLSLSPSLTQIAAPGLYGKPPSLPPVSVPRSEVSKHFLSLHYGYVFPNLPSKRNPLTRPRGPTTVAQNGR